MGQVKAILILSVIIFNSQCLGVVDNSFRNLLTPFNTFFQNFARLLQPTPELKELPGCGKRYVRSKGEWKLGECFWNCQWKENSLFDAGELEYRIDVTNITRFLPDSLLLYYFLVFEVDFSVLTKEVRATITLPRVPKKYKMFERLFSSWKILRFKI